jgi:hypothetical protein
MYDDIKNGRCTDCFEPFANITTGDAAKTSEKSEITDHGNLGNQVSLGGTKNYRISTNSFHP